MDPTRLRLLVELHRMGTMGAVAELTQMSTSAVSKHLAVLEREAGVPLLVPDGRRVRLTPAGLRLVEHGVDILARLEAAEAELRGTGAPAGRVRIVAFVTAATEIVLPALAELHAAHPAVEVSLIEHEPEDAMRQLLDGQAEIGVVYEYSLVPRAFPDQLSLVEVGSHPLLLATPTDAGLDGDALTPRALRALAEASWITNSRGRDDDELAQRLCAAAGFAPRIRHRLDDLEAIATLVATGLGVGVLPRMGIRSPWPGVVYTPLGALGGVRRVYLAARRGAWAWLPIRATAAFLRSAAASVLSPTTASPPPPEPED